MSMIGHINVLKMSILPTVSICIFSNLFHLLPHFLFSDLLKSSSPPGTIWNNRHPRLRLTWLYLPYDRGGKLPNFMWYYWAAQIRAGVFYFVKDHPPAWVPIESHSINIPLNLYIYSANKNKLIKQTKNPFLKNATRIWHSALEYLGETSKLSQFSPIFGNVEFQPGRADSGFKMWAS